MWHRFLSDSRFFEFLLAIDVDLAEAVHREPCECGGALHCGHFPRKPRGGPVDLGPEHDVRFSFCCSRRGCRQRHTPPSVRFLGRKVYFGAIVVMATVMLHGPNPRRVAELQRCVGVDWHTIDRWRRWWREIFAESSFWQGARGRFALPVDIERLPYSLWARFGGDTQGRLVSTLRFLGPVSNTSLGATSC